MNPTLQPISSRLRMPLSASHFRFLLLAVLTSLLISAATAQVPQINTVAGIGTAGYSGDGGPATNAPINYPFGVAYDGAGNIYIADGYNSRIREVSVSTGIISTVAGGGSTYAIGPGIPATSAGLGTPSGVAVDAAGNVYFCDLGTILVYKVTASTGIITVVAGTGSYGYSGDGGPATSASFANPTGVALDASGNLYISEASNNVIRKVNMSTGIISTIAGTSVAGYSGDGGPATSAQIHDPWGVAVDNSGNVYVSDTGNSSVRKINASTGIISTVAGIGTSEYGVQGEGGPATSASLDFQGGIAVDGDGNLYIADSGNGVIREVVASTGAIYTIAGTFDSVGFSGDGGPATGALLYFPQAVAVSSNNKVAIADWANLRIREVSPHAASTTTMVTISPITSYYQYAVVVNVTVATAGGTIVPVGGTVNCTAVPPTGNPITPAAVSMSGTSTHAQIIILGLPVTATGTSYSVTCAFTSADTAKYASSDSTASPALGTVVALPPPINVGTGSLLTPRAGQSATLLNDGTVLVAGGTYGKEGTDPGSDITTPLVLQSAEIYSGGGFAYAAPMTAPRWRHTATLLGNGSGQVLVTGGSNGTSALGSAELFTPGSLPGSRGTFTSTSLYDPATGSFTGANSQMNSARYLHTATLLNNGQVLLAGGQTSDGSILSTAELYNPLTGTFTLTGPMTTTRWMHTSTLLANGTVLIAGGQDTNGNTLASAEIYTPSTNQFTPVGSMTLGRSLAQATLLGNGTVLITGGASSSCGRSYPQIRDNCSLAEAEIYSAGSFTPTASSMNVGRYLHTATVMYDETVLITGGITNGQNDTVATEESYNVQTGIFTTVGSLLSPRYEHTATLLPNNVGVLLVGGEFGGQVGYIPVQTPDPGVDDGSYSAEIYEVTTVNGGLHPKYMVLDIMYAPPGSSFKYRIGPSKPVPKPLLQMSLRPT